MNILGIDIGTTSIKIAIYDVDNECTKDVLTRDTNSTLSTIDKYHHEQDVDKILTTINEIISEIDSKLLESVGHVGISGQMHGIMFWNDIKNGECKHSNFITWMDQRCNSNNFINDFSKMPSNIIEEMSVSSGYGCGTIFHLMNYKADFLDQWKYAGNIVDFFACILCGVEKPLMCPQIAHSWGYFDIINNRWFTELLKENNFPVRFLPDIVPPGTVVGQCKGLTKIPANARVYVGMGDLQCSMYGALADNLNGAINISTSAQFAVRVRLSDLRNLGNTSTQILKLPPGLVINPNFDSDDFLLVAASLNGGNVLEAFVSMLHQWTSDLSGVEIPKSKIWSHLTSTYRGIVSERGDEFGKMPLGSLTISPTLFGERYCPTIGASIADIFPYNCNLENIYSSICLGLVKNLTSLLPLEVISKLGVNHLKCSGGGIRRQKCLEDCIRNVYGPIIPDIEFTKDYDACVGTLDYLIKIIKN